MVECRIPADDALDMLDRRPFVVPFAPIRDVLQPAKILTADNLSASSAQVFAAASIVYPWEHPARHAPTQSPQARDPLDTAPL